MATLAHAAKHTKLVIIATATVEAATDVDPALAVLKRQSEVSSVLPLTRHESDAMLASVFGPVPNLALLSERIFAVASGNPRASLALAQYLVDRGRIVYAAGAWSLPDDLPLEALPASAEALFGARLARLGTLARQLAETQALSLVAALRREDYRVLAQTADARSRDDALSELIAHEIVRADGGYYALAHRGYATVLDAQLEPATRAERHAALARLAELRQQHPSVIAYHQLDAGNPEQALDLLVSGWETGLKDFYALDHRNMCSMLARVLVVSDQLGRPKRERFLLLRRLVMLALLDDATVHTRFAPQYRAQLEQDSGLCAYWQHADITDPAGRLRAALQDTQARYAATPAHERVFGIEEALHLLALYVGGAIAISARTLDLPLLNGLPGLLEPFASLSPVILALLENVHATCDMHRARPERAYERWLRVYERLEAAQADPHVVTIRSAVAYGIGIAAADVGLSALALHWIELLDADPLQRVNAMRLRRIVCLQHGDSAGTERAHEQAELLALQASGPQLFTRPLQLELYAHWLARDLAGVKQTADRIERLVANHPGWTAHHRVAQGYFDALRGDASAALHAFDACVAASQPDPNEPYRSLDAWLRASAAAVATLRELGRSAEARARGEHVLAQCAALEISVSANAVACELALAEAQSGSGQRATERLENVINDQLQRGVSGLQLGASYEARARIAIHLRNETDAMRCAALASREYRHGAGGALASRYARLLQEARYAGVRMPHEPSEITAALLSSTPPDPSSEAAVRTLAAAHGDERRQRALELLCKHSQALGGHLYLPRAANAELERVASLGLPEPSAALQRFATAFWQQQLEDAQMSAVLTELPWTRGTHAAPSWCDAHGERYEALLLYSARAQPAQVGLALLRIDERAARDWSAALVSTVATHLHIR